MQGFIIDLLVVFETAGRLLSFNRAAELLIPDDFGFQRHFENLVALGN